MKTLDRTPVHTEMLAAINAGLVEFRADAGLYGRFARRGGDLISDPAELVALYELKQTGLICVEDGRVWLTLGGVDRLREWSVIR